MTGLLSPNQLLKVHDTALLTAKSGVISPWSFNALTGLYPDYLMIVYGLLTPNLAVKRPLLLLNRYLTFHSF